ncbi:MAG: SCP2 sterol-binding domain-containing protein, partial [Candidatus Bathycorpusculaceae bacterium]
TVEYWRWCCLKRPDVKRDGIFLVFDRENGNLAGYAVVGLSGNIWELCVRPNCEDAALTLLDRAVSYLMDMGVSAVNVNVPKGDETINEACKKMDFAKVDVHKLFVGVLSIRKLISILAQDKEDALTKKFNERICITVENPSPWIEKAVSIKVGDGGIDVFEGVIESPTVSVKTDARTLLAVLFGALSPQKAFLSLRIRVKPFWKALVAERFLYVLRMDVAWFWPLGDFG